MYIKLLILKILKVTRMFHCAIPRRSTLKEQWRFQAIQNLPSSSVRAENNEENMKTNPKFGEFLT